MYLHMYIHIYIYNIHLCTVQQISSFTLLLYIYIYIYTYTHIEVSWNRATPFFHPSYRWIFHDTIHAPLDDPRSQAPVAGTSTWSSRLLLRPAMAHTPGSAGTSNGCPVEMAWEWHGNGMGMAEQMVPSGCRNLWQVSDEIFVFAARHLEKKNWCGMFIEWSKPIHATIKWVVW